MEKYQSFSLNETIFIYDSSSLRDGTGISIIIYNNPYFSLFVMVKSASRPPEGIEERGSDYAICW